MITMRSLCLVRVVGAGRLARANRSLCERRHERLSSGRGLACHEKCPGTSVDEDVNVVGALLHGPTAIRKCSHLVATDATE